ncbi:Uncharacterised protein (plasmid) [Mesomycoplasma conjunctivae]|uniref:Uncharacterized protein n=1 Tax=Mesomycoplasma conjunctivae (strain ATCC 25834 / NCTC 10147 / HRC/581) TaxID=572263 RepID=C5J6U8_MESCH|nr:hypothetical protein [Mesomycoplasma conjunctivae]CAT05211.1 HYPOTHETICAL PROTEIN MCJ_005060 [Mesomycoplasma conjunctivae]VEU66219.1 Uncharacterised protein [Mesomycoplasma conjunctivae]VEU66422.1 Uncharacterised protein [Mesomycoplasma conjunctivae]VEU66652.1 Uncharacterised protein [Mesomycoplasma conjunctivae]
MKKENSFSPQNWDFTINIDELFKTDGWDDPGVERSALDIELEQYARQLEFDAKLDKIQKTKYFSDEELLSLLDTYTIDELLQQAISGATKANPVLINYSAKNSSNVQESQNLNQSKDDFIKPLFKNTKNIFIKSIKSFLQKKIFKINLDSYLDFKNQKIPLYNWKFRHSSSVP